MEWNNITYEKLHDLYVNQALSDEQIGDIFNISPSKVSYKRKKLGITYAQKIFKSFASQNSETLDFLNQQAKDNLLQPENINNVSIALTRYLFRNSPVEDMHLKGQLSQNDMKILNKYMANRIAGILQKISDNQWLQLKLLYSYTKCGDVWDTLSPDTTIIDSIWDQKVNNSIKKLNE